MFRNESLHSADSQQAISKLICSCKTCMDGSRLSEDDICAYQRGLQSTIVDRRSPQNPDKRLMVAMGAKSILRAGSTVDLMAEAGIKPDNLPTGYDIPLIEPRELRVSAKWVNHTIENPTSGGDGNVFGSSGVFLLPNSTQSLRIPKMNALAVPSEFLRRYGAELIHPGKEVQLQPSLYQALETLYYVEYHFDQEYVGSYVLNESGGGGVFIEKHPFPQIFTPLSPACSGGLILGKDLGDGQYSFAAFEIPFGYTIQIQSMVIHGDSFFVGPYAIALVDTDLADTVLLRKDISTRDIQSVVQKPVPPVKEPLSAERNLANSVNRNMLFSRKRHVSDIIDVNESDEDLPRTFQVDGKGQA